MKKVFLVTLGSIAFLVAFLYAVRPPRSKMSAGQKAAQIGVAGPSSRQMAQRVQRRRGGMVPRAVVPTQVDTPPASIEIQPKESSSGMTCVGGVCRLTTEFEKRRKARN